MPFSLLKNLYREVGLDQKSNSSSSASFLGRYLPASFQRPDKSPLHGDLWLSCFVQNWVSGAALRSLPEPAFQWPVGPGRKKSTDELASVFCSQNVTKGPRQLRSAVWHYILPGQMYLLHAFYSGKRQSCTHGLLRGATHSSGDMNGELQFARARRAM